MATITAPGIASGIGNEIIDQLIDLERAPLNRLNTKQVFAELQISAYGSLKSKVSDFQSAMADLSSLSSFQVFDASSADDNLFTGTANSSATSGTYAIEVLQVAKIDKIATQAYTDSATFVGEGTLTIFSGTESFDVVIDSSNNTVAGIRDAINAASDNTGITATIVTDDNGAQLVLSSNNTGTDNALKITVADSSDGSNIDDAGLSALAYEAGVVVHRTEISQNIDAIVKIDGFTVTSSSNTVTGALEGINVTAVAVGASTLTVSRDDTKITESVQAFADAYNGLRDEINKQRAGQLEADSTLLNMERQLRDILNSGSAITGSNFSYLAEAGITLTELGKMQVDEDILAGVLVSDFESTANLFAAQDEGFAYRLDTIADAWLATDGLIDAREDGLASLVKRIEDQKFAVERRLEVIERRIRSQFAALDTLISGLNATGNFLTQKLANLPTLNNR